MLLLRAFGGALLIAVLASSAQAQTPPTPGQSPFMEELLRRIDELQRRTAEGDKLIGALQRRVDELESRDKHQKSQATTARREPAAGQKPPPQLAVAPREPALTANPAVPPAAPLRAPEPMGDQFDGEGQDALRSDLPGLSLRIPSSQSEIRFYGFANVNGYRDFNGRNQTDA